MCLNVRHGTLFWVADKPRICTKGGEVNLCGVTNVHNMSTICRLLNSELWYLYHVQTNQISTEWAYPHHVDFVAWFLQQNVANTDSSVTILVTDEPIYTCDNEFNIHYVLAWGVHINPHAHHRWFSVNIWNIVIKELPNKVVSYDKIIWRRKKILNFLAGCVTRINGGC